MTATKPFATPKAELVEISDLKPHPKNYKKHPDDQLDHLMKSIIEHGFYRNVVVARDNTIIAGHGVVQAVVKMGLFDAPKDKNGRVVVPVIRLDIDPDDPRALKIMIGDNELGKLAESDERALTEMLRTAMTADDLLGTGFDANQLSALLLVTRPESEIADKNAAAEWIGMPGYVPGVEPLRVVTMFDTEADRDEFFRRLGVPPRKKYKRVWSQWFPEKPKNDLVALRFDFDETKEDADV